MTTCRRPLGRRDGEHPAVAQRDEPGRPRRRPPAPAGVTAAQPRQARPARDGVELVGVAERRRRVQQPLAGVLPEFVKERVAAYKSPRLVWLVDELPKVPTEAAHAEVEDLKAKLARGRGRQRRPGAPRGFVSRPPTPGRPVAVTAATGRRRFRRTPYLPQEDLMTDHAQAPDSPGRPPPRACASARGITGYWWVGLVAGIAWLVVSLVILQFDSASITTVGILVGLMFLARRRSQNVAVAALPGGAALAVGRRSASCSASPRPLLRRPEATRSPAWRTCSASCS